MTHDELLIFIRRIVEKGSKDKMNHTLLQLEEILRAQSADESLIQLVVSAREGVPEIQEVARNNKLSDELIRITKFRAQRNRALEAEMHQRGRC